MGHQLVCMANGGDRFLSIIHFISMQDSEVPEAELVKPIDDVVLTPVILDDDPGDVELFPEAQKMPLYWENMFAEEKIVVDQGGMYSGKTEAILRVLFTLMVVYPNLIIHIVANTLTKLREDAMQVADRIYKRNSLIRHFLIGDINKSELKYTARNGSTMLFKSYETAAEAEGAKRDILYLTEARRIEWEIAYLLIKRTNWRVFIDYNPVARFWCHDNLINCPEINGVKEFPSVKVIRSWHIHNQFIPKEKHEEIENIADPELWKAYARGLTAQLTGLVFPKVAKVPRGFTDGATDVCWGVDLGFTNDPTVMIKICKNWKGYDYVFKAFGYAAGIPSGDMAHTVKEDGQYRRGEVLYMDHNKTVRRELRACGITAVHAFKAEGEVMQGILHIRKKKCAFEDEGLRPDEYGLEFELRRHSFATKDGKTLNKTEHKYSHGPRAIIYGCYSDAVRTGHLKRDANKETTEENDEEWSTLGRSA